MREGYQTGSVMLTIPADRSMLMVARLTTAGVLARSAIGVDKLDDAKMAVEEACSCLMEQAKLSERIDLSFRPEGKSLRIVVKSAETCPEEVACRLPDRQALEIVRCLLEALADEVEVDACGDWIREIRLGIAMAD